MGWSFTMHPATPGEVTREFLATDSKTVYVKEHAWHGRNQLWGILREKGTDKPVCIINWMVSFRRDSWGYKGQDESMGPVDIGCPLKFLDLVPDPGGYATEWRARVRAAAASVRRWHVGDRLQLQGCSIGMDHNPEVVLTSLKPLRCTYYGHPMRLTQRNLRDASAPMKVEVA